MKTLIRKNTDISLYIFEDSEQINITEDHTEVGNPVNLIIADCSFDNVALIENVTPPTDWSGWKYTFVNNEFITNPNYVDPTISLNLK